MYLGIQRLIPFRDDIKLQGLINGKDLIEKSAKNLDIWWPR
jgi:hypothetical protein